MFPGTATEWNRCAPNGGQFEEGRNEITGQMTRIRQAAVKPPVTACTV